MHTYSVRLDRTVSGATVTLRESVWLVRASALLVQRCMRQGHLLLLRRSVWFTQWGHTTDEPLSHSTYLVKTSVTETSLRRYQRQMKVPSHFAMVTKRPWQRGTWATWLVPAVMYGGALAVGLCTAARGLGCQDSAGTKGA